MQGVTAYQVDYSMAALTVRAAGSPLQPPGGSPFNLPMASLEGRSGAPFLAAITPWLRAPAGRQSVRCNRHCDYSACLHLLRYEISWASRVS